MKKTMMMMMTAAMVMTAAATAMAGENKMVEANGVKFSVPADLADLVTVETEGLSEGMLVDVYETASVEAAKAQGEEGTGAGWLFGISRIPEEELRQLRCGGMDGMEVFAEDEDVYLVFNHPTDVRLVRESNEAMNEAMETWSDLNAWAYENVRDEIVANDAELDPEVFTNTVLDMYLAGAAFNPDMNFELRSLEFNGQQPDILGDEDFIQDLADDFTYQVVDDQEAPDGEYIVLAFPDDDMRFDFFLADGAHNLVRQVTTINGEETETLYEASPKSADDMDETTTGIMQEWVEEAMNGFDD